MSYPSAKRIAEFLSIDAQKAKAIRAIMEGAHRVNGETRLERIDAVLGTCGVEYIPQGHNAKSPAIYYCNTGDTYRPTIMKIDGRFVLGCWGDWVERGNYD